MYLAGYIERMGTGTTDVVEAYMKIMNTLLTNRCAPLREIAQVHGVSEKTVKRDLNVIRQSYRIEWIGSPKTGRWEIEKL